MESKNQLVMLMEKYQVENILRVNEYTEKFGLPLSMEDARVLAKSKNETLKEEQRVELGESILPKIILCFCDSNYIDQNNYNKMIEKFDSYGNENYFDTVAKAIPGFFKYYDAKFSPQSTIITMDYPT